MGIDLRVIKDKIINTFGLGDSTPGRKKGYSPPVKTNTPNKFTNSPVVVVKSTSR
jgi:hypothetical protein